MADRCSCPDQGDAVVFGECRMCMPDPEQPSIRVIACTPPPVEGTYDPDLQEARIHQVLGPDELED